MSLKHEFRAALQAGTGHHALLELVWRHQAHGLSPWESYEVLEQIWQDLSYAEGKEGATVRENLEYVLEKVWFQGTR
jgi:hypothetical protein